MSNLFSAKERILSLFDEGSFKELDSMAKAGENDTGVITGYGVIGGTPAYAFSQDREVRGGAVGRMHAAKIKKVYDLAVKTGAPIVGIFDSNGAAVDEGAEALAAYGDLLGWSSAISGVVPQIAVVAGTCAGAAAMMACMADYVIMSEGAELFVTPPSIADDSAAGAGSAKAAAEGGVVSLVCESDREAIEAAKRLLVMLPSNNLSPVPMVEFSAPEAAIAPGLDAAALVAAIADAGSAIELSATFGTASYTALATLGGVTVGFIATNKTKEKLCGHDSAKIAHFVRGCDAYSIPVITLVDTEGFARSAQSELTGSARDMAKLAHAYAEATTAKITVVTGAAYGAAYIILAGTNAGSDLTFAWESAVISALAPETAAEFLLHDQLKGASDVASKRAAVAAEYVASSASAAAVAAKGYLEGVIAPAQTRDTLISAIEITAGKRASRLPKKHSNMPF